MFAEEMPLKFMRDNVCHRQLEQLFNAGLQNFRSHIDYLHIKGREDFKIPDTQGANKMTR